ncbi:adenylyl cyclase, partial [Kitasatospora sp. NPDC056327]
TPAPGPWAAEAGAAHAIVRGPGHEARPVFEKRCRNDEFTHEGRRMLATLVRAAEPDGMFPEVGTAAADGRELPGALAAGRAVPAAPGVAEGDPTTEPYTEPYTEAVSGARRAQGD